MAACVLSNPRRKFACALAGLAFGLACGVRLNGVILFPAFILSMWLHTRAQKLSIRHLLRDCVHFSASLSVCGLLIALANYIRFGSPLKTGYQLAFPSASATFSTPLFQGLFKVLFSGEFGLLVFAPWVLLALVCLPLFVREHLPESVLCATAFLVYLVFFAKFSHLEGGWVAGPRYLVPILPFLVVAMAPAIQRLQQSAAWKQRPWALIGPLMVALVGVGFLIQSVGTLFPDERYYALREFYEYKPVKPWWFGSVPMASIEFLSQMSIPKGKMAREVEFDQMTARHEQDRASAGVDSAATEDEYLGRFPNASNMTSPNLMLLKLKPMGLPVSAGIAYAIASVAIGFAGAVGLRRSIALELTG
jgi:hypothetical protein